MALERHNQHLDIARETSDLWSEVAALDHLASVYRHLRKFDKATECLNWAIEKVETLGNKKRKGEILGHLGRLWKEKGDPQKSISYHKQHCAIAHQADDILGEIDALKNLGQIHEDMGQYDQARIYWQEATECECRRKKANC